MGIRLALTIALLVGCGGASEERSTETLAPRSPEPVAVSHEATAPSPAPAPASPPPEASAPDAAVVAQDSPCQHYYACCVALSSMPGMEAIGQACEQVRALESIQNGQLACKAALQGIAAMPSAPPECV